MRDRRTCSSDHSNRPLCCVQTWSNNTYLGKVTMYCRALCTCGQTPATLGLLFYETASRMETRRTAFLYDKIRYWNP